MPTEITLRVGGERAAISDEEAQQILTRFTNEANAHGDDGVVTKLDLSCKAWSPSAVEIVRPILEQVVPTIVILDIQDTIASLETSIGLKVMELFNDIFQTATNVTDIYLSDNACGPRVLERIAPLLRLPKVKSLTMNNCGLSAETMTQLNEALMAVEGGQQYKSGFARLEALSLDRNMLDVAGSKVVGELLPTCVNLKKFSFRGCRPKRAGTKYIADGLAALVEENSDVVIGMTHLELEDCNLAADEMENDALQSLGRALAKFPELKLLSLNDGGDFEEVGTGIVATALRESGCKLESLDMEACSLAQDGATTLGWMLKTKLSSLKVLKVPTNMLEDDGVQNLLKVFNEADTNCLEELRLDENEIGEGAIDALIDAKLPKLRLLTLRDNSDLQDVDDDKKQELRSKFPNATICIDDDDEEDVAEQPDAQVDALADQLAGL